MSGPVTVADTSDAPTPDTLTSKTVTPKPTLHQAINGIKAELKHRVEQFTRANRLLEAQRLEQRTVFDLEMLAATGSCAGI